MEITKLELIGLAKELFEIQEKIKFLEAKKQQIATTLKEKCEFKTTLLGDYTYGIHTRLGNIKYENIPELKSVDLDQYRGAPVTVWKLSYLKQFDI